MFYSGFVDISIKFLLALFTLFARHLYSWPTISKAVELVVIP